MAVTAASAEGVSWLAEDQRGRGQGAKPGPVGGTRCAGVRRRQTDHTDVHFRKLTVQRDHQTTAPTPIADPGVEHGEKDIEQED